MGRLKFIGEFTNPEKQVLLDAVEKIDPSIGFLEIDRTVTPTELRSERRHHLQYDFDQNRNDYHRKSRGKNEPLLRALGVDKSINKVIDLTSGLAIDSVFMARNGLQVQAIERNAFLHFLAQEGQKASLDPIIKGLEFIFSDAKKFLQVHSFDKSFSAYFDPMYPNKKKKSALPRQEMVFFRQLVGEDEDSKVVVKEALTKNFFRVVVKRPLHAEPLLQEVSFSLETKLVRYDVYQNTRSGS